MRLVEWGGPSAALRLLHDPAALVGAAAARDWIVGAVGAFGVLAIVFLLCQAVGRGLLGVLRTRELAWPAGLAPTGDRVRLLAYASPQIDAFSFALVRGRRGGRPYREELILLSDGLLAALEPAEWAAVVAHELGHIRELDARYLTFLRTFARLMRWDPVLAVLAAVLTRREEFQADADAVELTRRPRALARAIFKASRSAAPGRWPSAGFLGPGGRRGQRQAMERIRRLVALAESGRFPEDGAE